MSEAAPPPPANLPAPSDQEVLTLTARLTRIYHRGGGHPASWSGFRTYGPRARARFDLHSPPPRPQSAGVMYLSHKTAVPGLATALAETFQDTRAIDRSTHEPWAVWWTPRRPLRLLDLASTWMTRAGNQALCSGDRRQSRRWARAIYTQLSDLEGVCWASSVLGAGRCVALWERAADAIPERPDVHRGLADPALLPPISSIARQLGYLLI